MILFIARNFLNNGKFRFNSYVYKLFITDNDLTFYVCIIILRSHPLMDSAVRHEGDTPAFYKRDLVLTTLVVDRQFVDMLGDDITYTVFYAGTSKLL